MSTSIEEPIRKVLVFVDDMTEECLELCNLDLSKTFLSGGHCPVKMSNTGLPPAANDLTIFFLAQFC